jgi:hypothetical protein
VHHDLPDRLDYKEKAGTVPYVPIDALLEGVAPYAIYSLFIVSSPIPYYRYRETKAEQGVLTDFDCAADVSGDDDSSLKSITVSYYYFSSCNCC